MGSGGGIVRSQGPMPSSQMAFQTPGSWNPQAPGQGGSQVFRLNEEVNNFNLFDMGGEDLSHQAACAGIPQGDLLGPLGGEIHRVKGFGGDLLGPLGGEGHRGKGQGGDDQRERHGDEMRSQPQGPLRQDLGRAGSVSHEQRHRSVDLLGDVFRGPHGDVQNGAHATPHRGVGANKPIDAVLKTLNVGAVAKNKTVIFVDFRQIARGKIEAVLRVKIVTEAKVEVDQQVQGQDRIPGHRKNENPVGLLGHSKRERRRSSRRIVMAQLWSRI